MVLSEDEYDSDPAGIEKTIRRLERQAECERNRSASLRKRKKQDKMVEEECANELATILRVEDAFTSSDESDIDDCFGISVNELIKIFF